MFLGILKCRLVHASRTAQISLNLDRIGGDLFDDGIDGDVAQRTAQLVLQQLQTSGGTALSKRDIESIAQRTAQLIRQASEGLKA